MSTLRQKVIRLAAARPDLRPHLLPLVKSAGASLQVGRTVLSDNQLLRIHRYRDSVRVTDLVNAGKRGKKCMEAVLYDLDMLRDEQAENDLETMLAHLVDSPTYEAARNRMRGFVVAVEMFASVGIKPKLSERELRGVDVVPAGFSPIVVETDNFRLESELDTFIIRDKTDRFNQPTCIPAARGGKEDVKAVYRWVKENRARVEQMTYGDILRAFTAEGIRFHDYCAVD